MVALEAVVVGPNNSKVEVPLFCLATERIIVRVRKFKSCFKSHKNLKLIVRARRATFWAKN